LDKIELWDTATGTKFRTLKLPLPGAHSVAFSSDGKMLASSSFNNTIKVWDISSGVELRSLTLNSDPINSVVFGADGQKLISGGGHTVKLWDTAGGREWRSIASHSTIVYSVALSSDGRTLAFGGRDGETSGANGPEGGSIVLWHLPNNVELQWLRQSKAVYSVAFSPDGKTLACGSEDSAIKLWDVTTGAELRSLAGHSGRVNSVAFSPNGRTLVSGSEDRTVKLWDVASGIELRSLKAHSGPIRSVAFSPNGKTLASGGWADSTIFVWDVSSGTRLHSLKAQSAVYSVVFSSDGKTLASGGWATIDLWNVASGTKLRSLIPRSNWVHALAFSQDGKMLISGNTHSYLGLWRVADGTELASIVSLDGDDWLTITPDGLFDGTPSAWNKILWRFNNNTFDHAPVEAFYNEFYYPGLLSDVFAGKNPRVPSDISKKDRRQPQLKFTEADSQPNVTLPARVLRVRINVIELAADKDHPTGSGAQDLRLFRNGSLVSLWRGDVLKGQRSATLETTVPIVAGENKLTAYAFNHDNIKSSDVTLTVTGAESLKRKGTLHILAVGVGHYANREYNLNYTPDDATSFAAQLKVQQEKLGQYQSIEIKTLLNEEATKENILAELKKLAVSVQPEDVVVVYFSGHGKADGDRFYLVPNDLGYTGSRDQLSADGLKTILAHSISDQELEEAFRDIDAGQMLMVIDACNSGQALENRGEPRRGPMNTRGLAQLAYEKGMYILTASQSVEEAFVSEKLKHSYLTYALVEDGLKTNAADTDHNGEVTLREWLDYAVARVPKLREATLQSKSLDQVDPTLKAAKNQKSQTPRVFYRREPGMQPWVVAKTPVIRK
jgi:WD40 repeat protein